LWHKYELPNSEVVKTAPGYSALCDAISAKVQHSVIADVLQVGRTLKISTRHLQIYPIREWRRRETETENESLLLELPEPFLASDVILA
jgi:hypothetical protein